ncbi:DNA ligase [Cohnella sp. CFH 77786]|uniref:ATP-dependent DNA ligase n=1 Tax=Cohnella sp. CFH 77786 TaxID=2662265 RepID=UPI001C609DF6|nr:DNA ligase [Cohnella sp. CFH 77786]MBW5446241.1 DNA ligase [Cohnella sp. CFH 77786]
MRPFKPMSPIRADRLPEGPEWSYQLKWDGYRLVASLDQGTVRLYTKNMLPANEMFPEIAAACSSLPGSLLLDGEAVVMDPETGRPSFQRMQQRNKSRNAEAILRMSKNLPVQYIVFDILRIGEENLRPIPYEERDRRLRELAADWQAPLFTTDRFADGAGLWSWVERHGWEGVVCKRLSSAYREGKEHRDWYKRKLAPEFDVDIVGILWREGRVASLVMRENGVYFGRVSLGLSGALKEKLRPMGSDDPAHCLLPRAPAVARGEHVRWLRQPFGARVTGTEITDEGILRHPKIVSLHL